MAEGGGTWDQQRHHYNSHVTNLSTREALQQRSEGPAQDLKHFHNHVKRQLLWRFAHKQDRLLDLCCGRGGDLQKWKDCQVKYVRGLDISEREVDEARRRYQELLDRRRGGATHLRCEFEAVDWLGERPYEDPVVGPASYGVVTCMFALHYFFVREASLRTFMANVAANLRQGGYFLGALPSGQRVQELLAGAPELRTPMLRLVRRWKGKPAPYGSGYICDIADTVTSSLEGATEGSLEYLVGLYTVRDYMDPVLMSCFEQEDIDAPFKRFKPFFLNSVQLDAKQDRPPPLPPSSLEKASSLYVAFVFQKVADPSAVTLPLAPECSPLQPPAPQGGRGRGPAWGAAGGGGPPPPGGHHPEDMGGPGGGHPMGHHGAMGHHPGAPRGGGGMGMHGGPYGGGGGGGGGYMGGGGGGGGYGDGGGYGGGGGGRGVKRPRP